MPARLDRGRVTEAITIWARGLRESAPDVLAGAALLRRSFAMFAARGTERVLVNVDAENITGATGVYERAGMRVVNRWDLWERPSAGSGAGPSERG